MSNYMASKKTLEINYGNAVIQVNSLSAFPRCDVSSSLLSLQAVSADIPAL